jgi:hypothetical protein
MIREATLDFSGKWESRERRPLEPTENFERFSMPVHEEALFPEEGGRA